MVRYEIADSRDIPALKRLWLTCFEEKPEAADLFFEKALPFSHAYKAEENSKIIAAVYLTDCTLNGARAHYLCGAATLPGYRNRGVMSGLICFALADAEKRGDAYSVLFPADEGLYRFYARLGYESRCGIRRTCLRREGDRGMAENGFPADTDALQKACFGRDFLLWRRELLTFASDYYAVYGIRTVSSPHAMAIYEMENNTAYVLYAVYDTMEALKNLLFTVKAEQYILTQAGGDEPYGMIRPLGNNPLPDEVFIGITLN